MKVKEESEKVGLKLNIQKTKIMASGPITSWQIDGETMETVIDFILGGSQLHPTPVLLPGKSHGWMSLVGCSPWGRYESDTTEQLHFHFSLFTFTHWRRKWQPTPVFAWRIPGTGEPGLPSMGWHRVGHNWSDSKITADGDWSHEIKRCLLLGRKVMTNLDSILRSRDITLPTKVCLVKASGVTLPQLPLLSLSLQIETHLLLAMPHCGQMGS